MKEYYVVLLDECCLFYSALFSFNFMKLSRVILELNGLDILARQFLAKVQDFWAVRQCLEDKR